MRAIVEAAGHQEQIDSRGIEALDSMLTRARIWAGADGEATLYATLIDMVREDPGQPGRGLGAGPVRRDGRPPRAGARGLRARGVRRPRVPGGAAHARAPLARPRHGRRPSPSAVRSTIPTSRVPARRALAGLAAALLGYGTDVPAPKPTEGSGLPPSRATELRRIGDLIGAPPFIVVRDAERAPRRATSAAGCASSRPSPPGC